MMKLGAMFAVALWTVGANAAFQASFDKDFTAESSEGAVKGTYSAEILWENLATYLQPGVVGTAMLIGTGDEKREDYHATWVNKGFITQEQGGVAFWIQPQDWDGKDKNFHIFFRADGPDADLLVYRYTNGQLIFLMGPSKKDADGKDRRTSVCCDATTWEKGSWHYVVATWGKGEMFLYVDGKLLGKGDLAVPGSAFTRLGAGGLRPLDWATPMNHSLIDELLLDSRLLTDYDALSVYLEQRPAGKKTSAAAEIPPEVVEEMKKPELWRGTDVGKERVGEVPPPWTLVTWDEQRQAFGCWNREYRFEKGVLPTEITSAGERLFSRAPSFALDGCDVSVGGLTVGAQTAEHLTCTASGAAGGYAVTVETTLEFDGFAWVDVELKPSSDAAAFKSLVMTFPFRKEASTLFNAMKKQYGDYKAGDCGCFKNYAHDLFKDESRCMFVGNDTVGLEWFCEEMPDWNLSKTDGSLRLVKGEKENCLMLVLADRPSVAGKTYRYRFGYQAQPVKPLARNWRRVRSTRSTAVDEKYCTPPTVGVYFEWERIHNVPIAEYAFPDWKARLAKLKAPKGVERVEKALWYFAGFSVSPFAPMWYKHGPEWSQTPPAVGVVGVPNDRQWAFARACPTADYIDYYVWNMDRSVRELDMESLYFDNQDPQFCDNALHGHGWRGQDGRRYKTYNLRANRELVQRIWRLYKRFRPEGGIMRHMSMKNISPVNGFADWIIDGENYCVTVGREESYKSIFDPEMFRASYMTAPYGIPRYFIPQFQRAISAHGKGKEYYLKCWRTAEDLERHRDVLRHFMGYFIVHDALVNPSFGITCNDWFGVQDRFGFDGSEDFILYTDAASPFAYDGGRVMTSVYHKPGGKVLVAIMNDVDAPLTALRFDRAKLSSLTGGKLVFRDAEKGTPVAVEGDEIRVSVSARDYLLLTND